MPSHKNQHFVPRSYFKPFSLDNEGKAINLYNIDSFQTVRKASVKGQCSKDYLYDDDGEIEHLLKKYEDDYARVLRVLNDQTETPTEQDLSILRKFMILQYSRTEAASKRIGSTFQGIQKAICESSSVNPPELDLSVRSMMLEALSMYTGFLQTIADLKISIVKNKASSDFVTSDDPVFFTSRFHAQELKKNTFGTLSAGALFFLPLSPRLLLVLYDADVYRAIDKQGCFISINSEKDVYACNELQYLNAAQNLYFSNWNQKDQIERQFKIVAPRRQDNRVQFSKLVEDGPVPGGRQYRQLEDNEKITDDSMLIRTTNLRVFPKTWMSKLAVRKKIRYRHNGSLAGYLREYTWQNRYCFK